MASSEAPDAVLWFEALAKLKEARDRELSAERARVRDYELVSLAASGELRLAPQKEATGAADKLAELLEKGDPVRVVLVQFKATTTLRWRSTSRSKYRDEQEWTVYFDDASPEMKVEPVAWMPVLHGQKATEDLWRVDDGVLSAVRGVLEKESRGDGPWVQHVWEEAEQSSDGPVEYDDGDYDSVRKGKSFEKTEHVGIWWVFRSKTEGAQAILDAARAALDETPSRKRARTEDGEEATSASA